MNYAKMLAQVGTQCVACGCCTVVCPKGAIFIDSGVRAVVDRQKCIGCGKCAKVCPAAVIAMMEQEAAV